MHLFKTFITVAALGTSSIVSALNATEIGEIFWAHHRAPTGLGTLGGYSRKIIDVQTIVNGIQTVADANTETPKLLSALESFFKQARRDSPLIRDSPEITSEPDARMIVIRYQNLLTAEIILFGALQIKKPLISGTKYRAEVLSQIQAIATFNKQSMADLDSILIPFKPKEIIQWLPTLDRRYNELVKVYST
ncbi:hypothetical protein TWF102_010981 [Orbilia oligospora]|uniref:Uncharacterized protein n=1 Tax=Orbilia oligospora TaxID=2813651 RepID=A0A7C8NA74_ORBOL|nr:hypothetical protein TWF102_010981 [Orbilia oligospora]KAF3103893.1 hypothetical protein TWF103_007047 [Orbilia oligospora]KAF3125960.1 hypothetical protein TWF703_010606 [Orbilia oligospora]KAF3129753.1 hypothetical protein TWF594_010874 [Orbilia oligospora]